MQKHSQFKIEEIQVNVYYDEDSDPFDWDFETEEEKEVFKAKYESGKVFFVGVEVVATDLSGHVKASDSLWGVLIDSTKPSVDQIKEIVGLHGMINGVKKNLENIIKSILKSNGGK